MQITSGEAGVGVAVVLDVIPVLVEAVHASEEEGCCCRPATRSNRPVGRDGVLGARDEAALGFHDILI